MPEENKNENSSAALFPSLLENLRKKKGWQIGCAIVIAVFLVLYFLSNIKHKREEKKIGKSVVNAGEEKREIFKERDLLGIGMNVKPLETRKGMAEKAKFIKRNYATDIAAFIYQEKEKKNLRQPSSRSSSKKLGIPAGTKIPAVTTGTIFSFNVAAPVIVSVSKDIERNGEILIPKDSQFLGQAGILKSLNRVNVNFELLIFPDGRQIRVRAMALAADGSSGIKGRVNKHRDTQILKALGETVLGAAAIFTGGINSQAYSLEDRLRENAFENLTGMARQDIRNVKTEVSITVDSFAPVQVIFLESV